MKSLWTMREECVKSVKNFITFLEMRFLHRCKLQPLEFIMVTCCAMRVMYGKCDWNEEGEEILHKTPHVATWSPRGQQHLSLSGGTE